MLVYPRGFIVELTRRFDNNECRANDYSRYIASWKLCTSMTSKDTSDTLEIALKRTGFDNVKLKNRPHLLSDKGPSYISSELAYWLDQHDVEHTRGKPYLFDTIQL